MNFIILVLGFLFGAILQYAKLNRYNVISGMATLENYAVAKAIATAIGVGAVLIAIFVHRLEKSKDLKWLYSEIGLAILNVIVFLSVGTNRVIGASTAYPYVADLFTGTADNNYFPKITDSGKWEVLFLAGAFLSGIIISMLRKEFKITVVHTN